MHLVSPGGTTTATMKVCTSYGIYDSIIPDGNVNINATGRKRKYQFYRAVQDVREGHDALFFEWDGGKAVRRSQWKLVDPRGAYTHWELYDMETGRTETRDLAAVYPERVETLAAMWEAWAERVGVTH